jgi:CheY-like chemotaxis protein
MKNKRILLINDDYQEAGLIHEILDSMGIMPELFFVENGRKALHVLMGSPLYPQDGIAVTNKMRPDIILLDNDLTDMSAMEFLGIMRKYYSLQDIKIFILEDADELHDQSLTERFAITGFLRRPFVNNEATRKNFKALEHELKSNNSIFAFPFLPFTKIRNLFGRLKQNILNGKLSILKTGSLSLKISAIFVGMSIITAAAIFSENTTATAANTNLARHTSIFKLTSAKADDPVSNQVIHSNHAGLYILDSGELDLKADQTLTFFSTSRSGKPCYKSAGYWKLKNDSTIEALFLRDSATVRYKILSDYSIAAQEIYDMYTRENKNICPIATPSLLIRIKGYYPDGNVEWAILNKWIRDHITQKLWGNCIYYFPTGEIYSKGHFRNGMRAGKWRYYDRAGKKIKTEIYKNGSVLRTINTDTI